MPGAHTAADAVIDLQTTAVALGLGNRSPDQVKAALLDAPRNNPRPPYRAGHENGDPNRPEMRVGTMPAEAPAEYENPAAVDGYGSRAP
jgi:hypothetical protein